MGRKIGCCVIGLDAGKGPEKPKPKPQPVYVAPQPRYIKREYKSYDAPSYRPGYGGPSVRPSYGGPTVRPGPMYDW